MSSCELCFRAKNFLSLILSFISPFPLSISFSLQVPKIPLISFHSIPFHFIPFLFHLISISFRFPFGCHSRRGRISNFNFHPAATSGAILTTLFVLRPCSVASSYKGGCTTSHHSSYDDAAASLVVPRATMRCTMVRGLRVRSGCAAGGGRSVGVTVDPFCRVDTA